MDIQQNNYNLLVDNIGQVLNKGKQQVAESINSVLVNTYWKIGKYIVEHEQNGNQKAEYGSQLLTLLSKDLTRTYGKGFSRSNLTYMRKLFIAFPKCESLSHKLSWSHYFEILKSDSEFEIGFYANQCAKENWSVRELKRQMKSMLFHRLAVSTDKKGIMQLAEKGQELQQPEDIIKDPYVLEFLNIPYKEKYLEGELEEELIDNLQHFLLELGKGFAFIGRQYRIGIAGRHFYVDLVFYHRILKCFVLIDLKRGEIDHQDIGQMNLYLNYFKKEEASEGDNEPIGIVLGAYKDHILMEYAREGISNQLFVSRYQLYLPEKEELERELQRIINK